MSDSLSKLSQIPNNNNEYRCPECSLVPFIEIKTEQNNLLMSTKCVNDHFFTDYFDKMQIRCKNNSNYFCQLCQSENNEIKIKDVQKLYYCSKCFKFYCYNHGQKYHNIKNGHNIFFNISYDNICFEHNGSTIVGYCANHNKNYCIKCNHFVENNKKIEQELNEEQIKKYENEINDNKKIIDKIETLFKNYKNIFKELESNYVLFKQNINKKNEFMKEVINIYKTKKSETSLNYQMKANIEINRFDLSQTNKNICTKINAQIKEINDLINLFKTKEEEHNKY